VTSHIRTTQVLGRSEFKQLLRWRLALRRDLKALLGGAAGGGDADRGGSKGGHKKQQQQQQQQQQGDGGEQLEEEEDAETKLLAEMAAVKEAAEKR
jgi:AdoMet-dependent rRNA methyltransferase SPB1